MRLDYRLEEGDYMDFNLNYILESKLVRKFFLLQKLGLAFIMGAILFLFSSYYQVSLWFLTSVFLVVYLGGSLVEALVLSRALKWKLGKDLAKDPEILGEKCLLVEEDGLHQVGPASDYLIKWKFVRDVEVVKDYVFVRNDLNKGYIIPKKYVEDLDGFLALIRSKKR